MALRQPGGRFNIKCRLTNIHIHMLKIRRSHRIPIPGKDGLFYWDRVLADLISTSSADCEMDVYQRSIKPYLYVDTFQEKNPV